MWEDKNVFHELIRCTTIKHGEALLKYGSLKFNPAINWKKDDNLGRGDPLEGAFAACYSSELLKVRYYETKYNDVTVENRGTLTYFFRDSTMNLPCICFFAPKAKRFNFTNSKRTEMTGIIDGQYFQDIFGSVDADTIEENKPMVIFIARRYEFENRLKIALMKIGIKHNEILFEPIEYYNKMEPFYVNTVPEDHPSNKIAGLIAKNVQLSHQDEYRVIIDTANEDAKKALLESPICIGNISDIAIGIKDAFEYGVQITRGDLYDVSSYMKK